MKLYTEDQLKNALYEICISRDIDIFYELESVTPIELPSDEEIDEQLQNGMEGNYVSGFYDGVDWLIEQIKQQVIP